MAAKDKYSQFMARKRKKMVLYEAFNRNILNSRQTKNLQRPGSTEQDKAASDGISGYSTTGSALYKPKLFQFNRGRVEISAPYPLAVSILLGILLVVLVSYRIGQYQGLKLAESTEPSSGPADTTAIVEETSSPTGSDTSREDSAVTDTTQPTGGNNRIVIQVWKDKDQLIPVQAYFNSCGIETEIRKIGQLYYLVTKAKYDNPQRPGTDGYIAKQRIIELGAGYKPPPGYGSFDFKSAYGMRFDD